MSAVNEDLSIPPPTTVDAVPDLEGETGDEESEAVDESQNNKEGKARGSFAATKEPEPWELDLDEKRHSESERDDEEEFDGEELESPEDEEEGEQSTSDEYEYEYDEEDYGEAGPFIPIEQGEDEETFNTRMDLVDSYLKKKALLKYLKKKNAYFQDRIYRTSVRKGVLIDAELNEGKKKKKEHKEPRKKKDKSYGADEETKKKTGEEASEEEEAEESRLVEIDFSNRKSLLALLTPKTLAEREERERREKQEKQDRQDKLRKSFGENFRNEGKYQKVVKKIIRILEQVQMYEKQHEFNLERHAVRREEWHIAHKKQLDAILNLMRSASDDARDSNTGKRMKRDETEVFCREITLNHRKLCSTMIKMYKCRRGLELSQKRLAESEIQGEGLQMLEYEQLRSENQILKDKLSDRVKDVDNIKQKITNGIQILAHFRSKLFCIDTNISEGKIKLSGVNEEVYAQRDVAENAGKRFQLVKQEQQKLIVESGLLDNPLLLHDYETSNLEFTTLRSEKRRLTRQLEQGTKELADIRDRIVEIKAEFPLITSSVQELSKLKRDLARQKTLFAASKKDGTPELPLPPDSITDNDLIVDPKMTNQQCRANISIK